MTGDAAATLRQLGDLVTPMALRVAATLHLVDHLNRGTTGLAALATATGAPAELLSRVLRHLIAVGVLTEVSPETYAVTELGALLAHDHPDTAAGWLDVEHMVGRADLAFVELLGSLHDGRAAYRLRYGTDFWADAAADPVRGATFSVAMARDSGALFQSVAALHRWNDVQHVMDVGGGTGSFLLALLPAHPRLRATLLELPGPAADARAAFARAGLAERVEVVDADFFAPFPREADAVFLGSILHDWADSDAELILRRCAAALRPGGRVLLVERAPDAAQAQDVEFTRADLTMLAYLGGRERTQQEWAALAAASELRVEAVSAPLDRAGKRVVELSRCAEGRESGI